MMARTGIERRLKGLETLIKPLPSNREQYREHLLGAEMSIYGRAAHGIVEVIGTDTWLRLRRACRAQGMYYLADAVGAIEQIGTQFEQPVHDRYEALFARWLAYVGTPEQALEQGIQWRMARLIGVMDGIGIEPDVVSGMQPLLRRLLSVFTDCDVLPTTALHSEAVNDDLDPYFCIAELEWYEATPGYST